MNVSAYQSKVYGAQPCWELVADIYATELNSVAVDYKTVNRSIREMSSAFRLAIYKSAHGFVQIATPVDYAIVLLGKTERIGVHHCGIYYGGKVLHALSSGTVYEDMSSIHDAFEICEFWAKP